MCRTSRFLVTVVSVLSMATVSYGVVIGDFEGSMDGWTIVQGSEPNVSTSIDTSGATLNQNSLKIQVIEGNQQAVVLDLVANNLVDDFKNNLKLLADVTRTLSDWSGSGWSDFYLRVRAGSSTGDVWEVDEQLDQQGTWLGEGEGEEADSPKNFIYNYSTLLPDIDFENLEYLELIFVTNFGGYSPGGTYYLDNLQLTGGGQAYAPTPVDGFRSASAKTSLSWYPGFGADTHDIYLSTSLINVRIGSRKSPRGALLSQDTTETTYEPNNLLAGKTYYWRVDAVQGGNIIKGDIWSFTTVFPGGAIVWGDWEDSLDGWETWNATIGTSFSTTGATLDNKSLKLDVPGGSFWVLKLALTADEFEILKQNDFLSFDVTFVASEFTGDGTWVQIQWIAINADTIGWQQIDGATSDTSNPDVPGFWDPTNFGETDTRTISWDYSSIPLQDVPEGGYCFIQFAVQPDSAFTNAPIYVDNLRLSNKRAAYDPVPENDATDVETDPVLSWTNGKNAETHNVYIGTNFDDVNDVNSTTLASYPNVTYENVDVNLYEPANLAMDTTYYWRVDEVNDTDISVGKVWSFTTGHFLAVDTFERYTDNKPNRIFDTWVDSYDSNTQSFPGSQVGYLDQPYAEQVTVSTGLQSMPLFYNNDDAPYYSETYRAFDPPWDFSTASNGEAFDRLSLFIHGRWASPNGFVYDSGTGQYTVTGSGTDIWNTEDQFHFVYQSLNGDGSITAKVESIEDTSDWAKAGIMIRNGLEPNAPNVAVLATPSGRITYQYREYTDNDSINQETGADSITLPYWVRLTNSGGIITGQMSVDGQTWENIPANGNSVIALNMSGDVQIGLAVTSQVDAGTPCEAVFSNVTVQGTARSVFNQSDGMDIGLPVNDPETLYVALQDNGGTTAVVNHPDDPNAVLGNSWTEFSIPLSDFSDQGLDLTQIHKLFIGLGNKNNPVPAGKGKIFVDDIRLYLPD